MIGAVHAGRDTGAWAVTWRPLLPFVITDPALLIAFREGVSLNQEQADTLRRRVAQLEASVQRWADYWGVTSHEAARRLLEIVRAEQGKALKALSPQVAVIIGRPIPSSVADGECVSP